MTRAMLYSCASALVIGVASLSAPAMAQTAAPAPAATPAQPEDTLSTIVVTASTGTRSKLDSSVSVSSVDEKVIQDFHPQSEGDLLRLLPGIQPNISGPGGNGNFAVRGLPVATGGATFVQLQEDGLPTVLYGDIQFGNNDYWTKSNPTDTRVEDLRGGTAATLASQAPGAVVNYISKTSRSEGGYVEVEKGVNYDQTKVSFLDSGVLNDTMYYNVGGYYNVGHGPHHASYNVSDSYQLKGNITKELDRGFFRVFFKLADTQEPNDTGGLVCGTLSGGTASDLHSCNNFDIRKRSNYSLYNLNARYVDYNSGGLTSDPLSGISTNQKAIQGQFHYDLSPSLHLDENARYSSMHGSFVSNFLSINPLANLIGSTINGQTVTRAVYSAGPNKGQNVAEPYYDNNVEIATHIRKIGGFSNDLKLTGDVQFGADARLTATAGVFFMSQKIAMDWHPNQFNSQVIGDNPSPIDLLNASGNLLSANGGTGYNNNWGGCCARTYDYTFTDTAPYADLILDIGQFQLDGSIRHDINHGSGSGTNSIDQVYNPVDPLNPLIGGPGTGANPLITAGGGYNPTHTITQTVINPVTGLPNTVTLPYFLPDAPSEVINYNKPLTSLSLGASFKPTRDLNLFVRASKGTRFNADRLTFGGNFNANGTLNTAGGTAASDTVYQYEIGLKNRGNIGGAHYTLELTAFKSHFNISTYELNPNVCGPLGFSGGTCPISDKYKTTGLEFFGTLGYGGFNLLANATYSKSKKQSQNVGPFKRSNAIPDLSYSVAASYKIANIASVGVDLVGVTSELNSNNVLFPGSSIVNANVKIMPIDHLQFGLNIYNLFNKLALLGPDNGNEIVTGNSFVGTASAAVGRTITASARFTFGGDHARMPEPVVVPPPPPEAPPPPATQTCADGSVILATDACPPPPAPPPPPPPAPAPERGH